MSWTDRFSPERPDEKIPVVNTKPLFEWVEETGLTVPDYIKKHYPNMEVDVSTFQNSKAALERHATMCSEFSEQLNDPKELDVLVGLSPQFQMIILKAQHSALDQKHLPRIDQETWGSLSREGYLVKDAFPAKNSEKYHDLHQRWDALSETEGVETVPLIIVESDQEFAYCNSTDAGDVKSMVISTHYADHHDILATDSILLHELSHIKGSDKVKKGLEEPNYETYTSDIAHNHEMELRADGNASSKSADHAMATIQGQIRKDSLAREKARFIDLDAELERTEPRELNIYEMKSFLSHIIAHNYAESLPDKIKESLGEDRDYITRRKPNIQLQETLAPQIEQEVDIFDRHTHTHPSMSAITEQSWTDYISHQSPSERRR